MRTLHDVASDPQKGDVVILTTGHVEYEVIVGPTPEELYRQAGRELLVARRSVRSAIGGAPDHHPLTMAIDRCAWADLVQYAGSACHALSPNPFRGFPPGFDPNLRKNPE